MPLPLQSNVFLPDGFDESKHCGATSRRKTADGQQMACMALSGQGTDHPGQGRCKFHGGATPLIHGRASKVVRQTIIDRVSAMERDPKLLSLDRQLAALHIQFDMQLRAFAAQGEAYEEMMAIIEEALETGGADAQIDIPPGLLPKLDMETVDMMMKISKTIFEMRFSKRFSMPLTQVQQLLMGLMESFARICLKYSIPNDARAEFAKEIRNLRALGVVAEDPQLQYAGGEAPPPSMIEGNAYAVS